MEKEKNNSTLDSLIDEIVSLCIEKNMTDEEVILVCSFPCDEKGIDKYGEIEALKVTISALRTFEEKEICIRAIEVLFDD